MHSLVEEGHGGVVQEDLPQEVPHALLQPAVADRATRVDGQPEELLDLQCRP